MGHLTSTLPAEEGSTTPASIGAQGHLAFLPERASPRFFLWGPGAAASILAVAGAPGRALLLNEALVPQEFKGFTLPLLEALPHLGALATAELETAPASWVVWSLAAKLALELVGRERLVPRLLPADKGAQARFSVALALSADAERVSALAKAFPLAAHAVPVVHPGPAAQRQRGRARPAAAQVEVWAPEALLRAFLDATADALVRASVKQAPTKRRRPRAHSPWELRLVDALRGPDATFRSEGFQERTLLSEFEAWSRPALGAEPGLPRMCFRLELPQEQPLVRRRHSTDTFPLRFFLQAPDDPSLLVPASEVFQGQGEGLGRLGCAPPVAEEILLRSLAMSARLFPPVERGLRQARPESVPLEPGEAWAFLNEAGLALAEAGMGVILPGEFTRSGHRRLKVRMRVEGNRPGTLPGTVSGASGLSLEEVLSFRWEVALAGEALSSADLTSLARLKAPLVRFRGQWVAVDLSELEEARRLLASHGGTMAAHEALAAALSGTARRPETSLSLQVVTEGRFESLLTRLREGKAREGLAPPRDFHGTLRPYQQRGLGWLTQMAELGLGACLADDMGLGKTIQLLAFLLHRRMARKEDRRPTLLVCPTSVVGNWERELVRFAPSLPLVRHHGPTRARALSELEALPPCAVVLTTYGLLRNDVELLGALPWSVAVLDEAQNIKNAASRTAKAARTLQAGFRVALTGTPVENRLAELWSLFEFLNPRLLGPLETFRREVAVPIERHGREEASEHLRRLVRPFILRRLKSDPTILQDLPPKQEMNVLCTLTREQASLYQAAVNEAMRKIEDSEGIQRRGRVLALIMALKQICNHPAQYLTESGPLAGRSGKLQRLVEMMEEVLASGERALIFTQFREMGERLVAELSRTLGEEVLFLHGGLPRGARDAMVRRFQEDPRGPRVFILSVKAGGTGLNLTAASHVFHFDRWWNPAVEDQATDRAYRIGQQRTVQVHKLLCAGTVEEKIDLMLEKKRDLASRVVGQGEQWITELDDRALRELFSLAPDAVVSEEPGEALA